MRADDCGVEFYILIGPKVLIHLTAALTVVLAA